MLPIRATLALVALTLAMPSARAVETALQLDLGGDGLTSFERHVIPYTCDTGEPFSVAYINAAPNFLALVPVDGETEPLVFAAILSASGARYAAGQWIWWTQGPEASLYDLTQGEGAAPVRTCSEFIDTP